MRWYFIWFEESAVGLKCGVRIYRSFPSTQVEILHESSNKTVFFKKSRIQAQQGIGMISASMIKYAHLSGGPVPPEEQGFAWVVSLDAQGAPRQCLRASAGR
jgi:hypothetical protein